MENINISQKTTNLEYQLGHGMKILNYLMDHIMLPILDITDNLLIMIYIKQNIKLCFKSEQDIILNF